MVLKLYYNEMSPAVRATLLTIKALEIDDVELVTINLATKEQLEPFYLKVKTFYLCDLERLMVFYYELYCYYAVF